MATQTFTNSAGLTFTDLGVVSQELAISGFTGTVTGVSIALYGLNHDYADDLDMLLVGQSGATLEFLSDAGGGDDFVAADVVFSDGAAAAIPNSAAGPNVPSGTYLPADYGEIETFTDFGVGLPIHHAPPNGGVNFVSAFSGLTPNGIWQLFVRDDAAAYSGSLTSWSLTVTTGSSRITAWGGGDADIISVNSTTLTSGSYSINGQTIATFTDVLGFNLQGEVGDDILSGGAGDDYFRGGAGSDTLNGGAGRDLLDYVSAAVGVNIQLHANLVDAVAAGLGFDTLSSIEGAYGGAGGDQCWGSNADNSFFGDSGNDWLHGFGGSDYLFGGNDSDQILGGDGVDYLHGEEGNDYFWFDELDAVINGGVGTDYAYLVTTNGCEVNLFTSSLDGVWAGNGNDILSADGMTTYAYLIGYAGADTITGGSAGDYIWVDYGVGDIIDGNGGRDEMYHIGTGGIAVNLAGLELEVVVGADGADLLDGSTVSTYVQLYGRGGGDTLTGSAFGDWLYGDDNNDLLRGNDGDDYINGGAGTDDHAQYASVAGNYTITPLGGGVYTVAGFGFTDTLVGVEFLDFDGGGTMAL